MSNSLNPWSRRASLSFTISRNLLKLMSIKSVMPANHLILCYPLFRSSIFPSIRVFSKRIGSSYQVAKVLELQQSNYPPIKNIIFQLKNSFFKKRNRGKKITCCPTLKSLTKWLHWGSLPNTQRRTYTNPSQTLPKD